MTLKQKREIVGRFKAGERVIALAYAIKADGNERKPSTLNAEIQARLKVEQVLRDYMNGKFELKPRRKK